MNCICCNSKPFELCCAPVIQQNHHVLSPEQLMRSRYSAYVLKQANYIYQTYAQQSKEQQSIEEINAWCQATRWVKLVIHQASHYQSGKTCKGNDSLPTVEFSAFYYHQGKFFHMRECSRFIQEQGEWRYLDGNIIEHIQHKVKRNELCPCLSNKKFKQCCGR